MMAEAPESSRSVPEAAHAVRLSLDRVRMTQRGYARVRLRASPAVVTRPGPTGAWPSWSGSRRARRWPRRRTGATPARAASDSRSRRITVEVGPVRGRIESSWRQYQQVRKSGGADQIARARAHWREALVDWFQALARQRAAEDGQRARELRPELEQAAPPALAPSAPGVALAAAPAAGGAAPRRDKPRYQPLAAGWTPAKRASGS